MKIAFRKTIIVLVIFFFLFSSESQVYSLDTEDFDNPIETYAILFDQFAVEVNGTLMGSAIELKDSLLQIGSSDDKI